MKRRILNSLLSLLVILFTFSCKKTDNNSTQLPQLSTASVIAITQSTASSGGNITSQGTSSITERGICWSTNNTPTTTDSKTSDSVGIGVFTSEMTSLSPNTTYYVRAYATNSSGTFYGNAISFTTQTLQLPVLTTVIVNGITQNTTYSGGNISSNGGSAILTRGVCWSAVTSPSILDSKTTDGNADGAYISALTSLNPNTIYYLRAYATNATGTSYGNELIFKTFTSTVSDINSNVYNTVTIGSQVWMAENLKVTQYNDASFIPNISDETTWNNLTSGAYCWYNNDASSYESAYGKLYNWYAVNTGKLCPLGWHVPTDAEWTTLSTYLGGESYAGGKMKEAGTSHWQNSFNNENNESGFTALPGGYRFLLIGFRDINFNGSWWSSSVELSNRAWYRYITANYILLYQSSSYKANGYSVRCLKD